MQISAQWKGCTLDQMYEFDSVELAYIARAVRYFGDQTGAFPPTNGEDGLDVLNRIELKAQIMLKTGFD